MKNILIVFIGFIFSTPAFAGDHTGKVNEIRFLSNDWTNYSTNQVGYAAIYFEPSLPKACGTGQERVIIETTHPLFDAVVSSALAAKLSGSETYLAYLDTCNIRSNSWDFGTFRIQ